MTKRKGRNKTILTKGMHRGFTKGINSVPLGKQQELRTKLRIIIGGSTRAKMFYWIHGQTIIQPDVARKIERVFAGYGIKSIWDE